MKAYTRITDCRKKPSKKEKLNCKRESLRETKYQWLKRLAYGPNKKHAELTNIWLSIFAVNARSLINPHWILDQINALENWQFSNYENLLYSQIVNPGLLQYLNAFRNKKNNPNENLGRELLELYTLGEGNFSELDVKNTSRALTGLILDKDNIVKINPKFHDNSEKLILGKKNKFELRSLIKWLSNQSYTAENITKRFCNYLFGEEVKSEEFNEIIINFKNNNLSLPFLYKSLANHKKYINSQKLGLRLLDPLSLVAKSISLIGSDHINNFEIGTKIMAKMGQPLLEPPNPKGFTYGEGWITSSTILNRKKVLTTLLADEEIWDTRNTPKLLTKDLVPFEPININLPAEPTRENIAQLFIDPAWNFEKPINLIF
tara:strand:+ start:216 stop:1340 length:1125 start_codon:yes stop_codon:yes gene_type:complete